ncbi:MAG: hypothetical protein EB127_21750 [Alphaproteobacteria bacterium]|nr:hypothetical protein [Alphaproteobacteria bacterium]
MISKGTTIYFDSRYGIDTHGGVTAGSMEVLTESWRLSKLLRSLKVIGEFPATYYYKVPMSGEYIVTYSAHTSPTTTVSNYTYSTTMKLNIGDKIPIKFGNHIVVSRVNT